MERAELNEILRIRRTQTQCLNEVLDLTRQMSDAVARRDEASANMVLSMREDPIRKLTELDRYLREYLAGFGPESAVRARELMEGAEAETTEEEPLCRQISAFRRTLETAIAADRQLSLKLGGRRSFYRTFRD